MSVACIEAISASVCPGPKKWAAARSRSVRRSSSAIALRAIASSTSSVPRIVMSSAERSIVASSSSAARFTDADLARPASPGSLSRSS